MFPYTAYLPGKSPDNPEPLGRYLPPVPEGIIAEWLQSRVPAGSLVLDPFGILPRLDIEAARAGYRVIVATNNPITRFLLELAARPATSSEYRSALAVLATARKGQERLEPHIRSLYLTQCDQCKTEVEAQAILWERDSPTPYARIYICPVCGESDLHPITEKDRARALEFANDKLHHARALERVAALDDPDRQNVEEALNTYLPRAVYALFTLINKLESLDLPPERRRLLDGLLLTVFDQANSLWAYPGGRPRPRQLTIPPRFRENNIWLALESSVYELAAQDQSGGSMQIAVSTWPEVSVQSGSITIFEGRLRDLANSLQDFDIQAVFGALPRPNQAFWTLSGLWAGWLWGKEAVRPFKSVLRRRRYDWSWHTSALEAVASSLARALKSDVPFLGMIGEVEPGFLSSAAIAMNSADFTIGGIALRADSGQAQVVWLNDRKKLLQLSPPDQQLANLATQAAVEYLKQRGEPAVYLQIHAAALVSLLNKYNLSAQAINDPGQTRTHTDMLAKVTSIFESAFTYRAGLLRYAGSDKSLEVGQWWLRDERSENLPLADRIEIELVNHLLQNPGSKLLQIDHTLCNKFPGLLTPNLEILQACLESYAVDPAGDGKWQIRQEDSPQARRSDLNSIHNALVKISDHIGYLSEGQYPLLWKDAKGQKEYVFYIIASAAIGEILESSPHPPARCLVVLPGGRVNLLLHKIKRNAHLNRKINDGWRFIKFRHVRHLFENPLLNRQNLDENLTLDPLQDSTSQIRLL